MGSEITTKFKVGDGVKVVCLNYGEEETIWPDAGLDKLIGEIGIVCSIDLIKKHPITVKLENTELSFGNIRCFSESELVKYPIADTQLLLFEL